MAWQLLGQVAPRRLRGARLQAHHAAQLIAAAGESFLEPLPDTSHTALSWHVAVQALAGRLLPGPAGCRVALRLADLTLLLLGRGHATLAELALAGRTREEASRWLSAALKQHGRGALDRALVQPGYALEPHPLAQGARFERDAGLPELARWYANADETLRQLAGATPGAGEVLCWPHHFDIATLIEVETDPDGNALRTVGVGFSPGDGFIDEPYWYVNHGPETERKELPPLAAGEWFTDGWIGALLRGSALVGAGDAVAQQEQLRRYLAAALSISRELAREGRLV